MLSGEYIFSTSSMSDFGLSGLSRKGTKRDLRGRISRRWDERCFPRCRSNTFSFADDPGNGLILVWQRGKHISVHKPVTNEIPSGGIAALNFPYNKTPRSLPGTEKLDSASPFVPRGFSHFIIAPPLDQSRPFNSLKTKRRRAQSRGNI